MPRSIALAAAVAVAIAGTSVAASAETPQFKFSELPPPAAEPAAAMSLYDIFATGDVSPLGTPAATVKPADLFDKAAGYVSSSNGQPGNPAEAEFWLKRAVLTGPDETGKRRAWAASTLGLLFYQGGEPGGQAAARELWEMAGAWNSPSALCYLGELLEHGDNVTPADPKAAVVWYQRAKKAGCVEADAALSRLKR